MISTPDLIPFNLKPALYKFEVTLLHFFQGLNLPALSNYKSELLNTPISLEELKIALNTKKGKSSGWDGIPPELHYSFWDELGPLLLEMIYPVIEVAFNVTVNTSIITLLPRPNQALTQCLNHIPLPSLHTPF